MTKSLIREDELGTYVRTGGYAFRAPADSVIEAGEKVNAHHIGGTTTAKVGGEIWHSNREDPQYIAYAKIIENWGNPKA